MSALRDIEIKTPKIPFYTHSMGKNKSLPISSVGKNREQLEVPYTAAGRE